MRALIVIDVQNEFSNEGQRPVPTFNRALSSIKQRVKQARANKFPIAWVRHFNKPNESRAFVPGSWGAAFADGFGPADPAYEKEFCKDVYGAFTGSDVGEWLVVKDVKEVMIVGFYTHGCVSTTAREAIMRGMGVYLDPTATAACEISDALLGQLTDEQVKQSALLHLVSMGAHIEMTTE